MDRQIDKLYPKPTHCWEWQVTFGALNPKAMLGKC